MRHDFASIEFSENLRLLVVSIQEIEGPQSRPVQPDRFPSSIPSRTARDDPSLAC